VAANILVLDEHFELPPKRPLANRAWICQNWPTMSTGETAESKPLFWVGSSRDDLREFPEEVSHSMGFALWQAQLGRKHRDAKVLKGFGGAGCSKWSRTTTEARIEPSTR
jgi:hypothetical protein